MNNGAGTFHILKWKREIRVNSQILGVFEHYVWGVEGFREISFLSLGESVIITKEGGELGKVHRRGVTQVSQGSHVIC